MKAKKDTQYRCSACDLMKHTTNVRYHCWDTGKRKQNCSVVGICQFCDAEMKRHKFTRVEAFVSARPGLAECQCYRMDCVECVERRAKSDGLPRRRVNALVLQAAEKSLRKR